MNVNPKQYQQHLAEYLRLAALASFRAGKRAGILHEQEDHASENEIIDQFNATLEIGAAYLAEVGKRLDGYILAEQLASGQAEVIPGDWRVV